MTEKSYFWLSPTGDASLSPYDADSFSDFFRKLFEGDRTVANILMGHLDNLEVTNPGGLTVRVNTGAALVDGKLYTNDAVIDFSIPIPLVATVYYRAILRKTWTTKTIQATLLSQTGSYPSLTQDDTTPGSEVWEVSLAQFTMDTSGALSAIIDNRRTMASNRYKSLFHANSQQTNRYKVQLGVVRWTGGASATGNVTVTFPYAYDVAPTVFCTQHSTAFINCVVQPTTTNVVIYWKDVDGTARTQVDIAWMAIGAMARN